MKQIQNRIGEENVNRGDDAVRPFRRDPLMTLKLP